MSVIAVRNLQKSFGRNVVLDDLSISIEAGEFVGLMGPNGAGKSTLIKILGGVHERSSGEISYEGAPVRSLAERPEVGFIHQDLGLVESMSIVDNLRLGERAMRLAGPLLDRRKEDARARHALEAVALDRHPGTLISELSPGEKTLVALARLLDRGATVLFVDEATSTLPVEDSDRLIRTLRALTESGATVIMVSHKLSEILDATNRVVLLLDGRIAADEWSADLDRDGLVSLLTAHEAAGHEAPERDDHEAGEELLRLEGVSGGRASGIDLTLRAGEIVGLTGLPGSGLHDVAYLAHGSMRPTAGRVVRRAGTRTGIVPPHRESQGGYVELDVLTNLTLSSLRRWRPWSRLLARRSERRAAEEMITRLNVQPPDPDLAFGALSGGNKQKVIFGRIFFDEPDVYVLCEPTRGVDIGTRLELYRLIHELRSPSTAVLVVTSDSEDLFALCDRIAAVDDGELGAFVSPNDPDAHAMEAFV